MTTKQVTLDFGFIKQLCKRATGLVHTNFFSYFNPITGRSEHIDQRDSGDFNYPLLLADTSNNNQGPTRGKNTKGMAPLDLKIFRRSCIPIITGTYSQVPIKRVGPNKRVGWIF